MNTPLNPDSEEKQSMTRENRNEVRRLKMMAEQLPVPESALYYKIWWDKYGREYQTADAAIRLSAFLAWLSASEAKLG